VRRKELSPINVHYDIDPRMGLRRIYSHDVSELEVEQVLQRPTEDHFGDEGSRVVIGATSTERTLRVIYAAGSEANMVFVITAYDLRGKSLLAHRRRRRRTPQ
jgi:hypothetical protein